MTPRYIFSHSPSTSVGSSPIRIWRRPWATLCDPRASTIARQTSGDESTSPMPTMPSSVCTRITRSSWLPSAIPSSITGCRRTIASTSVIRTRLSTITGLSTIARVPVIATIDLDRPGKQLGQIRVPRSTNTGGWSNLVLPIGAVANGDGPTALVIGGVHGDEPEGQVAALNLLRALRPADLTGRVVIAPCLSITASQRYTRLWPTGANLNRSFPGSPDGTLDEQLADYVTRELIAAADIVVDIHSGGRSGLCLPWSEMHWVDDPRQRAAMVKGMLAWGSDWCVVYIDIAGGGLLVGEAERQGKVVVSTELGGGGHVTAAIHRLALSGLQNVLRS